jgi:hypothetical protein
MLILRPLKAIRVKCLDCSGGSPAEVRACEAMECSLFPYRLGHRPVDGRNRKKPHGRGGFQRKTAIPREAPDA